MISFFDVHAHYTDKRFSEYGFDVDFILRDCFSTNVYRIVNSGTNPENSKQAVEMAKRYPGMCASVGIHPTDAFFIEDCDYALGQIEHLILQERYEIAAIGEIGLDYYHEDMLNKSKQKYFFDALLSLSEKHRLPVVIHCREAMGDCLDIVRLHPNSYGVFHCYAGSAETAKELIKRNYFISVCGNVTYKKSDKLENVIRTVGAEHLLTETDAPYMAPAPLRGTVNNSSNILHSATKMAQILDMKLDAFSRITRNNADSIFKVPKFCNL